jgi:hypothetical protein
MAVVTGRVYVDAPNPVVPRYGLFRAATGPLDLPLNARNGGLQYQLNVCDLPDGYANQCQDAISGRTKNIDNPITTITADPFIVYSSIQCSPVGLMNLGRDKVQQYLYQQLVAGEQTRVENILGTNTFGISPNFSTAVNLGNAQGPVRAIAMLEDWLYARYGLPGVIHAPMFASPYIMSAYTIERDGYIASGVWRTAAGTAVSFGFYGNLGPTGQVPAANDVWMYITGQVAIWRTPDSQLFIPEQMGQLINRSTNVFTIVMEREYVVSYDCYVAAVQCTMNTTDR